MIKSFGDRETEKIWNGQYSQKTSNQYSDGSEEKTKNN